jgi:phosphatidylserine/phosphatidylglycerophosphate/cardiolipin synthase-like enzyme
MKTRSSSDKITLGRGYGIEILEAVKHAEKSVKIVSPYLSGSYLEELVILKNKGVDITLITSDNLSDSSSKYAFDDKKIIKQEKTLIPESNQKKRKFQLAAFSFFLFFLLSFSLSVFFLLILFLSAILFIISISLFIYAYYLKEYNYKYSSLFRLKVFDSKSGERPGSTSLVHSKIFIIDEKICFLGSANFTWSGFKTHYETIIKVEDIRAIRDIIEEVEKLFESKELRSKDIDEWGRKIYGE